MAKLINEALRDAATRRFFAYKADAPADDAPEALGWTRDQWESFSPGMRREISRQFDPAPAPAPKPTLAERRAAVEYAGRKRL